MASAVKSDLETQLAEWRSQLEEINQHLALNPDSAEFIELKSIVETGIDEYQTELAKLQTQEDVAPSATPPPPSDASPAPAPKWSVENHPAYQNTGRKAPHVEATPEPEPAHAYSVNEKVQVRYRGKYYTSRILAITGSSKDPKFTIKFDGWADTPTVSSEDLKPIAAPTPAPQATKRKAEEAPTPSLTYSAAANVNPELASQAKKEPSKVSDGPPRQPRPAKKLKNNKVYEKSANDWKSFNSKMTGKGKLAKKESMFRTGAGVNARVGFTGSGKPMSNDQTRTKNRYDQIEQDEDN